MEPPAPDPAAPPTAPAPAPEPAPPLAERAVLPQAPRLNPWIAIWVRPRATMRQILETDPRRFVHRLVAIGWTAGMAQGLVLSDWGDAVPAVFLPVVFVLTAALGSALGLVLLYLNGFLLRLTGRWLEGQGDAVSIRAALAWCQAVPSIWRLSLIPPWIAALGGEAFHFRFEVERLFEPVFLLMLLIQVAVAAWQLVVFLKCLGEAHRFSAWRALSAVVLEVLILLAPFAILVLIWVGVRST